MMLGKPVIMTRLSDYYVLVDVSNGFLCDADNTESTKEAFKAVAKLTKTELEEMGMCSKEKALSMFSKKVVLEQ